MAAYMFCKIDGIDGESGDSKHQKWINVQSFNHNVTQPVSTTSDTGGRTAGRADFGDFTIIKIMDVSTPALYLHCSNGKHIPKVEIEFCEESGEKHTYMKYILEDVIISSISPSANPTDKGNKPTEHVSFNYGKIEWEYTPIDELGRASAATRFAWNLEQNRQA